MAADLVQRDKAVVAVKGRVFEALRHDRAAVLLQLHRTAQRRFAAETAARLGDQIAGQQLVDKIEDAGIDACLVAPRLRDRPVEIAPVKIARAASVGASSASI